MKIGLFIHRKGPIFSHIWRVLRTVERHNAVDAISTPLRPHRVISL